MLYTTVVHIAKGGVIDCCVVCSCSWLTISVPWHARRRWLCWKRHRADTVGCLYHVAWWHLLAEARGATAWQAGTGGGFPLGTCTQSGCMHNLKWRPIHL
jgi:hypothetical protein